jgi:hypothetical protein
MAAAAEEGLTHSSSSSSSMSMQITSEAGTFAFVLDVETVDACDLCLVAASWRNENKEIKINKQKTPEILYPVRDKHQTNECQQWRNLALLCGSAKAALSEVISTLTKRGKLSEAYVISTSCSRARAVHMPSTHTYTHEISTLNMCDDKLNQAHQKYQTHTPNKNNHRKKRGGYLQHVHETMPATRHVRCQFHSTHSSTM